MLGHLRATRLSSYPLAFRVLREYPLAGVGGGLYPAEGDKQRALLAPEVAIPDPYLLMSYAPNQFLNTGVELGLPAMAALALVFVFAGWAVWPRRDGGGSAPLFVSLLALAGALQLGPAFLNSEAVVFLWLIIGLAVRSRSPDPAGGTRPPIGPRATVAVLAGALTLGLAGQVLARPRLAVEDYRAEVSFYVDGILVEKSLARAGRIRESVLPLPAVPGFKRISVRVFPPFVPAGVLGGSDRRPLGVFIHSLSPTGGNGEGPS